MERASVTALNYYHRGLPRPSGECPHCGDQVMNPVAAQGQSVLLSDYAFCNEVPKVERLKIDLEHAEDQVAQIRRQIARAERTTTFDHVRETGK